MMSQTLEKPAGKPIKKYYMGQDPFRSESPPKQVNGFAEPAYKQQQRKTVEVARSQTLPRQPKPVVLLESSLNNSSKIYSDTDRSLNDTTRRGFSPPRQTTNNERILNDTIPRGFSPPRQTTNNERSLNDTTQRSFSPPRQTAKVNTPVSIF